MKCHLLFVFFLLGFTCHAQTWLWGSEGSSLSDTWGVGADNSGNAYLTGRFNDSITFGKNHLTSISIGGDAYIVKYDSSGNILWAKQSISLTSTCRAMAYNVCTDLRGNTIITGQFRDTVSFGPYTLISKSTYGGDAFTVKYDNNGNVLWAKQSVSYSIYSQAFGNSVATDTNCNIYVTGGLGDTVSFGSYYLRNDFAGEVFLIKYDSNGNVLWAKQTKNLTNNIGYSGMSVSTNIFGDVFITGAFVGEISFSGQVVKSTAPYNDIFLAKYDGNGNVKWVKQSQTHSWNNRCASYSVAADRLGNSYITGGFTDSISFGINSLYNPTLYNNQEIFLVEYDSLGNVKWAKQSNNSSPWFGYSLAVDMNNHLYFAAGCEYPIDSIFFCGDTLTINNASDASLIMKFDNEGNVMCHSMTRTGGDDNNGIACSSNGKYVYFGGDIADTITFNKDFLNWDSAKEEPPFIARWQPCAYTAQGINQLQPHNLVYTLFPNPNKGKFIVKSANINYQSSIDVYNMLGDKIYSNALSEQTENEINLGDQPAGIYLYRVISDQGNSMFTGKFIIEQ